MFELLARFCFRHRWPVLAASLLSLVASALMLLSGPRLSTTNIAGTESEQAFGLIDAELHQPVGSSFTLIARSRDIDTNDPRFRDALERAVAPLRADPRVGAVQTPWDLPDVLSKPMRSADGHAVVVMVAMADSFELAAGYFPELRAKLQSDELELTITGALAFKDDLDRTLREDLIRSELVAVPLALVVLLLVFGTLVAAIVPVAIGSLAVIGGMAVVFALSHVTEITQYSLNIVSLIGTGVAIDYSLFIVSRFRDEIAADGDVERALERTMATAGRAVAFSGFAVAIGLLGMMMYAGSYIATMGVSGTVVVLLAVLFALTTLPALLATLGPHIDKGRILRRRRNGTEGWRRLATWVMRHPVLVLVPTLGLTLLAGLPFLRIELRAADVTVLPAELEARRGFEMLRADFPDFAFDRVIVVVRFPGAPVLTGDNIRELYATSRRIAEVPHVKRVESIVDASPLMGAGAYAMLYTLPEGLRPEEANAAIRQTVGKTIVLMSIVAEANSDSDAIYEMIRGIRSTAPPPGGQILATGRPAVALDSMDFIAGHTPSAVAVVITLMALILFVLLRSVVLPLEAVIMNVLSITASFGALVWIFQDGHFASVLDFEAAPVEPTLPVILFCAVFGLSMDYEVLMLSRIQEEYRRSGDNARAVADGLAYSAPLITSAAAIMVAVFAAFVVADIIFLKAVGLGVAIAVLLDATLIRMLIVPATMRLFGRFNWWAPRCLGGRPPPRPASDEQAVTKPR